MIKMILNECDGDDDDGNFYLMLRMALGNYEHVATGFKVGRSSFQANKLSSYQANGRFDDYDDSNIDHSS